ncbi:hypothetical protein [Actinomadura vinacea]|uniref:hypothetical protein n=1 Tax=Actinomadura vinacea TaxID=115336 RepID=UPI0031D6C59B
MQPTTAAPPVPSGRSALDAWRELDRGTRGALMRGDRAPDPTTAVIAVGYARAELGRPYWRRAWPALAVAAGWAVAVVIVTMSVAPDVSFGWGSRANLAAAGPVAPAVLLYILWLRRRSLAWHRMESLHAAALWVTEHSAPSPAVAPSAAETTVRYDLSVLRRQYVLLVTILVLGVAFISAWDPVVGLGVAAFSGGLVTLSVVLTMRWGKPHLPALHVRADGIELPASETRVAWHEFTEIRVAPFRAFGLAGKKGRASQVVVFVAADPEALISRLKPRPAKRARTSLRAYGGPVSVADLALDRPAAEIAAAASALSGLPLRRFGP